ncbi:sll0787 family AIR synthase-like protein [Azospirillum sp. SYSU D00513]|uniref:sll0787 family AIR synthase-like protein n=1 Tax=Azospirillum sp. SYSU D00513 TaxID=2812561 RepID=UPI001A9575A8|nr:sll0787 family AIR synthase-like protein [Azospirillum sp. SYSU D00513]
MSLSPDSLATLADTLRASRGIAHKRDIDAVVSALSLGFAADRAVPVGDDCAAIPDGDGHLLLAIEGFLNEFVADDPWFAGWCGVMVNLGDVAAMGGRPVAVVDAVWSRDAGEAGTILDGLRAASAAYGVPVVGGHSNTRNDRGQLSVAVLGRAKRLLTSFDARPGDRLLAAIDLRGRYREPAPYFDAATAAPPERLRGDLEILPALAEDGLCRAAKDVSMGGVAGTALMLMECSGVGGTLDVTAVPRPPGAALDRWLLSFPSYGYLLSVAPEKTDAVVDRFAARGIACAAIGGVEAGSGVRLSSGGESVPFWDFAASPLIGCGPAAHAPGGR